MVIEFPKERAEISASVEVGALLPAVDRRYRFGHLTNDETTCGTDAFALTSCVKSSDRL
jgi:hypothetical protein